MTTRSGKKYHSLAADKTIVIGVEMMKLLEDRLEWEEEIVEEQDVTFTGLIGAWSSDILCSCNMCVLIICSAHWVCTCVSTV